MHLPVSHMYGAERFGKEAGKTTGRARGVVAGTEDVRTGSVLPDWPARLGALLPAPEVTRD